MARIITTEIFKEELKILRPDIEVLGEYTKNNIKILVKYECGYKWEAIPYVFNGKNRKYFPDIFVRDTNTYFEVKSTHTLGLEKTFYGESSEDAFLQNQAKSLATKAAGLIISYF